MFVEYRICLRYGASFVFDILYSSTLNFMYVESLWAKESSRTYGRSDTHITLCNNRSGIIHLCPTCDISDLGAYSLREFDCMCLFVQELESERRKAVEANIEQMTSLRKLREEAMDTKKADLDAAVENMEKVCYRFQLAIYLFLP